MSVVINSNSTATLAANNFAASTQGLQRSLARLSSGSKIVNPSDDAGGLAVSMKLSAAARRQAATAANASNAISFLQTQDGSLKVAGKVLDRVSELRTLYSDVTKNSSDLANYNAEFAELQDQLTAISTETFNGIALFGSSDLVVPTTEDGASSITLSGINLLATGSSAITINLTQGNTDVFTPSGAGTLTVSNGDLDFAGSANTYLDDGDSATYDGAGNWTLPVGLSAVTGTSVNITTLTSPTAVATFTIAGSTTDTGTVAGAANLGAVSISTITDAIAEIATHRASNGALQSRLGFASELLSVNHANLEAANSRIVDVDVAEESTTLARYNILTQAGASMLSQANQSAQAALKLIG